MKHFPFSIIRCLLVRFRNERLLDEGPEIPASTQAHLSQCDRCREWFRLEGRLVQNLRREARAVRAAPSESARRRIMDAIAASYEPPSVVRSSWRWASVAGAAVLALGLTVWWMGETTADSGDVLSQTPEIPVALYPVQPVEKPEIEYVRELERLIADGRAGARFVMSSFPLHDDY